ncbi:MAG: DedA family protein [Bacillota bacterium]
MAGLVAGLLAGIERAVELPEFLVLLWLAGLVEVFFPPFPGDTVFALGGFVAGRRHFFLLWPLLAAWSGTCLAGSLLYFAGRYGGRSLLSRPFFARLLPEPQRARVEEWFGRYGLWVLCGSRFIPVVRSGITLAAGMAGLPPGRALMGLALGAMIFNSLLVAGGYLLGERWRLLAPFSGLFGWALGLAVVAVLVRRCLVRRQARQ